LIFCEIEGFLLFIMPRCKKIGFCSISRQNISQKTKYRWLEKQKSLHSRVTA